MLNIVVRCGDYVSWFLLPETFNKKQFDALLNLPGAEPSRHIALWDNWIRSMCGKYSGPRTLEEFDAIDGREVNIKVDNGRVYIFNDPVDKTLFNIEDQWYEIYNFDRDNLPWLNWMFKEPGESLADLTKQFMDITGATFYTQSPVTTAYILRRYHYNVMTSCFIPTEVVEKSSEVEG